MADNFIQKLTKINMLNLIIGAIVIVWVFSQVKAIILTEDMTQTAQKTIDGLQNIMLMVLGYYLKQEAPLEEKESVVNSFKASSMGGYCRYNSFNIKKEEEEDSADVTRSYTDKIVDNGTER